jgi:hypothetical protein
VSDWEIALVGDRADFVEALARSGFSLQEDEALIGTISVPHGGGERRHTVEITVPDVFPFAPPHVRPLDGYGTRSWHQDRDGGLCLYSSEEGEDLPWREPSTVIDRVREWFVHDESGWPDDAPDLDLERYFDGTDGLLLARDLDALIGKPIRTKRKGNDVIEVVGTGTRPRKGRRRDLYGWAVDIGEPERPPRTWDELQELLNPGSAHVVKGVESSGEAILVVRYMRKGYQGSLGLVAKRGRTGIELTSIETAEDGPDVLRLRGDPIRYSSKSAPWQSSVSGLSAPSRPTCLPGEVSEGFCFRMDNTSDRGTAFDTSRDLTSSVCTRPRRSVRCWSGLVGRRREASPL